MKFPGHVVVVFAFPPAQYDPATQIAHGLVPVREPSPKYPGWHRQLFWDGDMITDTVFSGHWFCTPALHQLLAGHGLHTDPFW